MLNRVLSYAVSFASVLMLSVAARGADSWPTFRGAQRTAVSPAQAVGWRRSGSA